MISNITIQALEYVTALATVYLDPRNKEKIKARDTLFTQLKERVPNKSDQEIRSWALGVTQGFLTKD
ncbi:MAG: hypothetical protein KJI72_02790 [Patescibacteria group bacterium]|nr:hypothetical protein [Patescibacteria group bacterium]